MTKSVEVAGKTIGEGHPVYIIGEIGINHNGDVEVAKKLIDAAVLAGCDAVKFQKRTPELCVPQHQRNVMRETPWGTMSYLDYRHKVEFGEAEYRVIEEYCKNKNITWFASCWDTPSVEFMEQFEPACYKIASAALTDHDLLMAHRKTGRPIIISTGMSTLNEIDLAIDLLKESPLLIAHCTSSYPCPPHELNLRMIQTLKDRYGVPVGYSGHEVGLQTTMAAVALGACFVERHITLDRAMWGSDHAASVEPWGLMRLVRDIRVIERGLGDGVKKVYDSELPIIARLRKSA
ncbi:MAG: N-acetylneuraminate synthase family protein [Desulfobacteraceae bacterium]|nr:N-acetylneuraminate synthase family protein [Desulfobacteraceae bacterium]